MADRNRAHPRRRYLIGVEALFFLSLLVATNATYASPGSSAGHTQLSGALDTPTGTPTPPLTITPTPVPVCVPIWEYIPSPSPGDFSNVLNAVAAISANDVWAVGSYRTCWGCSELLLTIHWDGTQWSRVPIPNPSTGNNYLNGVAATSANDVWAVGYYQTTDPRTFIEHWNGAQWSIVSSPALTGFLYGVAAISSNDVWAVGTYDSPWRTLTEHWDGTQWSLVPSPAPGSRLSALQAVTAFSTNNVWAVGSFIDGGTNVEQTLTAHWDGTGWTQVPSPNVGSAYNELLGVSAASADEVWAVGWYRDNGSESHRHTLIEHWSVSQSRWTVVPGPNPGIDDILNSVAVVSAKDVWAVGYYATGYGPDYTLIAHWDGGQWAQVPGPASYPMDYFFSVAAASSGDVRAVGGGSQTGSIPTDWTLTQRYSGRCITATPTPTGTPPTATPTNTPPCNNYIYTTGSGTIVPGTTDIGNHCIACVTGIDLPFPIQFYDSSYTSIHVSSAGNIQFADSSSDYVNICLNDPDPRPSRLTIYAYWDYLRTDITGTMPSGIYTSISGVAPGRIFNIEWRTVYGSGNGSANFEVRLHEGDSKFDIIYGKSDQHGSGATVGVRNSPVRWDYTEFSCNLGILTPGLQISFVMPCLRPTPPATETQTREPLNTPTSTPTGTPPVTFTPTGTETPCPVRFRDVQTTDYFYQAVGYLYCHGTISGYQDGTFRPYSNATRGQLTKIVVLAHGWTTYTPPTPTFQDVPATNPFYTFIETAYNRGIISGYTCGPSCREFRPGNNVARGQLSKIIVLAQGWTLYTPPTPTFQDVPPASPFYAHIETAYAHSIISGYSCGPSCLEFRPGNNATRGQISKIVYLAITQP